METFLAPRPAPAPTSFIDKLQKIRKKTKNNEKFLIYFSFFLWLPFSFEVFYIFFGRSKQTQFLFVFLFSHSYFHIEIFFSTTTTTATTITFDAFIHSPLLKFPNIFHDLIFHSFIPIFTSLNRRRKKMDFTKIFHFILIVAVVLFNFLFFSVIFYLFWQIL